MGGRKIIVYKPLVKITEENRTALQFLDLMSFIDKYSELSGHVLQKKLKDFVKELDVDFGKVKEYISYFPDKVYRNIYHGGLMNWYKSNRNVWKEIIENIIKAQYSAWFLDFICCN